MPRFNRQPSRMQPAQRVTAHHGYLEERHFEAVVTVAAIVAVADGHAEPSERAELVGLVDRSSWLPTCTTAEAGDAFDSRVREFELAEEVPEAAWASLRLAGDGPRIQAILNAAVQVALADGHIRALEEKSIGLIRLAVTRA